MLLPRLPTLGLLLAASSPALPDERRPEAADECPLRCACTWEFEVFTMQQAPPEFAPRFESDGGTDGQCTYFPEPEGDYCEQHAPCKGPFTVDITVPMAAIVTGADGEVFLQNLPFFYQQDWDPRGEGTECGANQKKHRIYIYESAGWPYDTAWEQEEHLVGEYLLSAGCTSCDA